MFLSIIIPIYNDEKYISECLDSCLHQNISSDDYEIICVDDGSTDHTPDILKEYASKYSNIILIFNQHRGGTFGRNVGMLRAKGDYVWFVDHDDYIEENVLAQLKDAVKKYNCDRLNFPCYIFKNQLSEEELQKKKNGSLKPDFMTYRGTIWSNILRRSFLIENDIWPKSKLLNGRICWGSDGFFIDETRMAGAQYSCVKDRPYYYYRVNDNQQTANHSYKSNMTRIQGTIEPILALKEKYDKERKEYGKAQTITADVLMQWAHLCMMYLAPMDHKSFKEGKRRAKEAGTFPMAIVPEYSYTLKQCIIEHREKGEGLLRTLGYYYSTYEWGLALYRATMWKRFLKVFLKKIKK